MDGIKLVLCKPHGNHKAKTFVRYTKDEEKGILTYHYRKIIRLQRKKTKEEERDEGITKQPENDDQNGSNYLLINNHNTCKETKFFNQKTYSG